MVDPGDNVQDAEELILEISDNLARFTTLGLDNVDASFKEEEPAEMVETKVDVIIESQHFQDSYLNSSRCRADFGSLFQVFASFGALASMLKICTALVQAAINASLAAGNKEQ